jgi:glutathione S-transferase
MTTPAATPELFHFHRSHYNEKARWGLDFKGVPHIRRALLPGPHRLTTMRISRQPTVPLLRVGDEVIAGSARILEWLESAYPDPPLYPAGAAERQRAVDLQRWLDDEVGPAVRRALFWEILPDGAYVAAVFAGPEPAWKHALYRAMVPAIRVVMRREMDVTAERSAQARATVSAALDRIQRELSPSGFLVGDAFTVADLTAAALLALTVSLPGTPMAVPEPLPRAARDWYALWSDHPTTEWIRDIYARFRGTSAAT